MPDFPIVDSHVHLADPERFSYSWAGGDPRIRRRILPADLHRAAGPVTVDSFVFIELLVDDKRHLEEAAWVEGIAAQGVGPAGIVAALRWSAAPRSSRSWSA